MHIALIERWARPTMITLPTWLLEMLLSLNQPRRRAFLYHAAICGTQRTSKFGQVSYDNPKSVNFPAVEFCHAKLFEQFGNRSSIYSKAAILRTCIFLGLELYGSEDGVISQTRFQPYTFTDCAMLYCRAKRIVGPSLPVVMERDKYGSFATSS